MNKIFGERQCFFETENLIIDRLNINDVEEFHRICNQEFVLKWMDDWRMDLEQIKSLLNYFIIGYNVKNPEKIPFILAIRIKNLKLIGICGFGSKGELDGETEIAYFINEQYSNKGYMSQIVSKAIDFYFSLTNKPYLSALVDENNIPSKKILLKNNFKFHLSEKPNVLPHYRIYNK